MAGDETVFVGRKSPAHVVRCIKKQQHLCYRNARDINTIQNFSTKDTGIKITR